MGVDVDRWGIVGRRVEKDASVALVFSGIS